MHSIDKTTATAELRFEYNVADALTGVNAMAAQDLCKES